MSALQHEEQIYDGRLDVRGTLRNGSRITVTRLDTGFSAVTETLSYNRGMRTEIAGGLLTGAGRVIAPSGTDSRGGVFNTRGTVRPGNFAMPRRSTTAKT